jgi:hypothetical protein
MKKSENQRQFYGTVNIGEKGQRLFRQKPVNQWELKKVINFWYLVWGAT